MWNCPICEKQNDDSTKCCITCGYDKTTDIENYPTLQKVSTDGYEAIRMRKERWFAKKASEVKEAENPQKPPEEESVKPEITKKPPEEKTTDSNSDKDPTEIAKEEKLRKKYKRSNVFAIAVPTAGILLGIWLAYDAIRVIGAALLEFILLFSGQNMTKKGKTKAANIISILSIPVCVIFGMFTFLCVGELLDLWGIIFLWGDTVAIWFFLTCIVGLWTAIVSVRKIKGFTWYLNRKTKKTKKART